MFILEEQKNNRITMTRGDDTAFRIMPTWKNNVEYELQAGDVMTMTVRKKYGGAVSFSIDSDRTGTIRIPHNATSNLTPGFYIYDLTLIFADGKINTIVSGATLELIQEVM